MSYGFTAYESYVRIHVEMGQTAFPGWTALPHVGRMAWEAAAQAVALAVLPADLNPDPLDDLNDETEIDELADDSGIFSDRLVEPEGISGTSDDAGPPYVNRTN